MKMGINGFNVGLTLSIIGLIAGIIPVYQLGNYVTTSMLISLVFNNITLTGIISMIIWNES
jgi:hypothetical protein